MSRALLQTLNPAQVEAVTAPDGPVLVIAAAGTGKTQTLTHRMAWLVLERHISPRNILLLTFTNRAANEMLERAAGLIDSDTHAIWGGTFHSVANRMLRVHARRLGYSQNYTILDEDDSVRLLRHCTSELKLTDKKFPKPKVLSSLFGLATNRAADLAEVAGGHFRDLAVKVEDILRVHELYREKKLEQNQMDFDDLLVNGLRLLTEHPDVLASYRQTMRHVLVDEFQDTNRLQADFVRQLVLEHRNLMAVGDDFQSIYSWRGAEVQNILAFEQVYPGARVIKLEDNYRSTPDILNVANSVIAGNPEQYQKVLRAKRPGEVKPVRVNLTDGGHQARYIVAKVKQLVEQGAARPSEIAVLYRSHYQAMELQMELMRQKLDYVLTSGVRFFEQAHIKDICCLPRLAANPTDGIAFMRLLELLPRVGPKTAEKIWGRLDGYWNLRDADKWDLILERLPKDAKPLWEAMAEVLRAPSDTAGTDGIWERPDELIHRFNEAFYADYAEQVYDNAASRQEDIGELVAFSAKYGSTTEFLSEMALLTNLDAEQHPHAAAKPANAIRLTTVHQAKGLEWKAVFVLWLAEGLFPAARSLEEAGNEAEERRLFYVAITRAKDYLWLCAPRMRKMRDGGMMYCETSRFLSDVDESLLQIENPGGFQNTPSWARWR